MERLLLIPKSFTITLLIVNLFLFSATKSFATVKTWNGGAGATLNWNSGSWSPSAPSAGDDIVFNTPGTLIFTTGPSGSIAFNSFKVLQGSVTLSASAARNLTIGGAAGTDFSIASGAGFSIGNNITIIIIGSANADITGSFQSTGGTFALNSTSTVNYNGTGSQTVLATTYSNLTISGSGIKTLSGTTTVTGLLTMSAGTLNMANTNLSVGALTGSGNLTHSSGIAGARTLSITGSTSPAAYTGIISNGTAISVLLNKSGSGTLTLSGTNTFTGSTTISAGTVIAANTQALGSVAGGVNINGCILDLATNTSMTAYNIVVGGNTTIISNRASAGAGITHTLGTLSIGNFELNIISGAHVNSGTAGLTFGTTTLSSATPLFELGNAVNLTLGTLVGNVPFTKHGDGVMILNAASVRTAGNVTVNSGAFKLVNPTALGTTAVGIILNGGTGLHLNSNTSVAAYPLTINGLSAVLPNRSTPGAGIIHTLGPLTIGSHLTVHYGDMVTDAAANLVFGTTTLTGGIPEFDVSAGTSTLTLGALSGNFPFIKMGGGTMILNNASARTSGKVTLEGGTTSLGATNALGTNAVPLQLNGGILELATNTTVNAYDLTAGADATIISNRAAAGAGITHVLGTLNIGGYKLDIDQGAAVTSGTAAVQFGNLTMTGAPILSPNTANLIIAGTATGVFKLTKSGAGTLQKTTSAWTLGGDLEITGGTYDATTQNTTILGNWINNGGTLAASGSSNINFSGVAAQLIAGSSSTTFHNLIINNAAGVSLSNDETVNAALTLTNGILTINTGNTLTIANGNVIGGAGFGTAKHIATMVDYGTGAKGFLRVNNMATAAYLFPTGNGSLYLPVTLTPSNATLSSNTYSICVFPGITLDGEPNGTPFTTAQKNNCVDAVWTVNYNGPGTPTASATNMTVGWDASLEGVNFPGYSNPTIGIAHWDGPNWGPVVGSGDNAANTATRTGITTFSPFGVGRIDPTGGVLAIKITYFNASKGNGYNTVNWQANCSSAQAIFEVLRSTDGINFTAITSLTATQARCAQPFNYTDNTAPSGTVYYRLKVVDVDGKVSYSAIVKLTSNVKDMQLDGIAPNPVVNFAQLKINASKKDVVDLAILSVDGKLVYHSSVQLQAGTSIVNLDIANLPAGMYMIKGVFSDGQTNTIKFTKK